MPAQTTISSFYKSQKYEIAKPSSLLGKSLLGQKLKSHPYARLESAKKSNLGTTDDKDDIKIQSGSLRGISQNLLERVRAKERDAKPILTRDQHRSRVMASRLPEMMNIIRTYFFMEKKNVLAMETVCNMIFSTSKSCIGKDEVEEHIQLLCQQLPEWLVILTVRKEKYVRVNKTMDDSSFESRLEAYISKVREETEPKKDPEALTQVTTKDASSTDNVPSGSRSPLKSPQKQASTVLDTKSPNTLPHPNVAAHPRNLVDKPLARNKENASKSNNKRTAPRIKHQQS